MRVLYFRCPGSEYGCSDWQKLWQITVGTGVGTGVGVGRGVGVGVGAATVSGVLSPPHGGPRSVQPSSANCTLP